MPARRVLAAATESNARILGLARLGKIAPGFKADIILLDMSQPHLQPFYNSDFLVYSGSGADVATVIINGQIILKERRLLSFDLEECMNEVRKLAAPLGLL
jgi:5-methylthioadenosine/S-adenosylhomocysteine deaminase